MTVLGQNLDSAYQRMTFAPIAQSLTEPLLAIAINSFFGAFRQNNAIIDM